MLHQIATWWYQISNERRQTLWLHRLSYSCLCSSAGSIGTSLASQSPSWTTPSSNPCGRAFSRFFAVSKKSLLLHFLFRVCVFFFGMYEHVVEHLPQVQRSTALLVLRKAAKQVRADQSATTRASRQSWQEPACWALIIQLAAFSKRTKKSKSAWPIKR